MNVAQLWVVIGVAIGAAFLFLVLLVRRGGNFSYGNATVFIPDRIRQEDPMLAAQLECLEERLPAFGALKRAKYLHLLEDNGVEKHYLNGNEDYREYILCVNIFIYSMNGLASVQAIMQREIVDRRFEKTRRDSEWEKYVNDLTERIIRVIDTNLNRDYDSQVMTRGGEVRTRSVTREQLYEADHDPESVTAIHGIVEDVLFAAQKHGCRDEEWNSSRSIWKRTRTRGRD